MILELLMFKLSMKCHKFKYFIVLVSFYMLKALETYINNFVVIFIPNLANITLNNLLL